MDCKKRNYLSRATVSAVVFVLTLLLAAPQVFAESLTSYYDWGPYYYNDKQQVLGVTFSSLEKLPAPAIPAEVLPPPAQGILPGSPLYNFELLTENIQLALTFNPVQRETQRLVFAQERLSEVKTLVEEEKPLLANTAASVYKDTMNAISQNTESLSSQNAQGAADLVVKVEAAVAAHAVVAQSLVLTSPPNTTSSLNEVIDATEKAMDTTADVRKIPAIPEDLSTSIQELKEQGLITAEESDKLYGFSSRAQVREELDKLVASGQFPPAELLHLNQAVAANYPQAYKETQEVLRFAELRTYQTLTPPSTEIVNDITRWQGQTGDTPPPGEIRPYLYYNRAQELAKEIDFSRFEPEQQSEVARFYPESVVANPTFSGTPPAPSPSPSPSPSPAPSETGEPPASSPSPIPSPSPSPAPAIGPYLTDYKGPLPGTFGYFFKNLGEQAALATTFSPVGRMDLEMKLADERLAEAAALSSQDGQEKQYAQTLEKYRLIMNAVSDNVKSFGGPSEDKKDLAEALEQEAARHNVVFEKGLLPAPTEDIKFYTDALNATEDAMDKTSDVLGRPALPLQLANRLQDMKAQGLILEEEVSDLTNANSREEVREKIRDLTRLGTFPPADAKKLDEGQALVAPQDYNQLVEVRKIEELQGLRAIQAEFAQTATLRQTGASYEQRVKSLLNTIDPSLIKEGDLAGREDLIKTYREIAANAPKRPINGGQFGADVVPGAPLPTPPASTDAVLGTCPIGSFFKQFIGCVWEDTGKIINDYEQYRCERPGEYWSFVSQKCVPVNLEGGGTQDGNPACPIGYTWSWQTSSCQLFTGGGGIIPSPSPQPSGVPINEKEISKSCPAGASYQAPRGCVWDANDKPVYDETQYRCGQNTYYSFVQNKCVPNPEAGKPFPDDARPNCKEENEYWNWGSGKCVPQPKAVDKTLAQTAEILTPRPIFAPRDSPFYFLKQAAEAIQVATAIAPKAREEVKLAQAKERIAEAYALLEKDNEEGFKDSLGRYIGAMQAIYNDIDKGLSLSDEAKKALGEKLAEEVNGQNLLLQKVSIFAPKDAATPISAATSVITQGIDRAADLEGQPAISADVKEKLDALPEDMLTDEQKKKLAEADTRLEARLITGELVATGALTPTDIAYFDNWMAPEDSGSVFRLNEIKKLSEATQLTTLKEDIAEKVEKTEDIAEKLDEFKKSFAVGQEVPADVRPYVRLTRIDEISKTIRPDAVRLEDFGNRKDVQLAVATLQQEFRPTREDFRRLEDFRRGSPGRALPPELARIEALSFSIGVRDTAQTCFLPSPPFAANTPCPPTGASIPISSYYSVSSSFPGIGGFGGQRLIVDGYGFKGWSGPTIPPPVDVDKEGKPLVYGKGPEAAKPGVCPDGYHWMYELGGWCMSNSGNYSNIPYSTPPSGPNYTPYTPYYSAPGYPPTSYGYQGTGTYPGSPYPYSPPNYYGTAPTTYTTNPPPGTVPGSGPQPTSPGQCPDGYHWMPPSAGQAGWCMSNGGTYVGGGGYGGGGGVNPPQSCPSGSYWSYYSNSCVTANFTQGGCGAGYYLVGDACVPSGSLGGGGYGGGTSCSGQTSFCDYNSYWDSGSCSCRSVSTNTGGGSGTGSYCSPPSGGCGSGWFDYGSCSCKAASSQGCYNVSASSCGSGFYWDSGACTCRSSTSTSGGTTTSGGGTTSGSCPSGYHWMSDSGGWCMSDGTSGGGSTPTSTSTSSGGSCPSGSHWMSDNGGWCMSDSGGGGSTPTSTSTSSSPPPAPTSAPAESTQPAPTSPPTQPAPTTSP